MKRFIILCALIGGIQYGFKVLDIQLPALNESKSENVDQIKTSDKKKHATPKNTVAKKTPQTKAAASAPKASQSRSPISGRTYSGSGTVSRVLSDDTQGSQHQRFILTLPSGKTLLIAHNIDLAPRVSNLKVGDTIVFSGIYESNSKGGVVHWTHRDPRGKHVAGWLKKNGRMYQ